MWVQSAGQPGRYGPAESIGAKQGNRIFAHVERHNLTTRISMRHFTRLTLAFSKKIDNRIHALAIYFVFYNFTRIHKMLRMSPAMAAGITDRLRSLGNVVPKIDEMAQTRSKRGPYKKRES